MAIKSRNKVEVGFSMSSMTDVVFLLLIFFMITSTLVTSNAFKVKLPSGEQTTEKTKAVNVSVTAEGKYMMNGEEIAEAQLESMIQTEMSANPEASLMVHGDEGATHGDVMKVMNIAYRNKYQFAIATARK